MLNLIFGEFKKIFLDFGAALILFGAVFIYAFFYPLPYLPEIVKKTPIAVIDEDFSPISRALVRSFRQNDLLSVKEELGFVNASKSKIYDRSVSAVVLIPKDFSKNILSSRRAGVEIYVDASYFLVYRQAFLGLAASIKTLGASVKVKKLVSKGIAFDKALSLQDPVSVSVEYLFNPIQGYLSYILPGVLILILHQTLIIGMGLIRGSNFGKMPVDCCARLFTAKFIAFYVLYMSYLMIYFYGFYALYGFVLAGSFADVFLFSSLFLFALIPFAIFLSYAFKKRESSMQFLLFTSIIALFLTGVVWPREAINPFLYYVSLALPSNSAIIGFAKINQMGADLTEYAPQAANLFVLGVVYSFAAFFAFKKHGPFIR